MPSTGHNAFPSAATRWPEQYAAAAQHIHDLGVTAAHDPDIAASAAALEAVRPHYIAHRRYLTETADRLTHGAEGAGSGLTTVPFAPGEKAKFVFNNGEPESPLDLARLGLPAVDERVHREKGAPIAVVLHDRQDGMVGAVELLWRGGNGRVHSSFLENISAAVDDDPDPSVSRWVAPGDAELSSFTVDAVDTTAPKIPPRAKELVTLTSERTPHGAAGTARIIRSAPGKVERLAAGSERSSARRRRGLRALGTLAMAGVMLAVAPLHATDPEKNRDVTSAKETVLPGGTAERSGVSQAERYFDEATLSRSRAAFDAYFKGDTAALRAQLAQFDYQPNWMRADALDRVRQATSFAELEQAFGVAVAGLPIKLAIGNNSDTLASLTESHYQHTQASNFKASQKLALSVLGLVNSMDKTQLGANMEPLQVVIVGDIHDPHDSRDPEAYCDYPAKDRVGQPTKIVLSEGAAADADRNVVHEWTHYEDFSQNAGRYSENVSRLNPLGHVYAGGRNGAYEGSLLVVDGVRVTSRAYGNASEAEDAAVAGEDLRVPHPVIKWDRSTLTEKREAIMFELEEVMPGSTAALLLRTRTQRQSRAAYTIEELRYALDEQQGPLGAAGLTVLLGIAISAGRRLREARKLAEYTAAGGPAPFAQRLGALVRRKVNT